MSERKLACEGQNATTFPRETRPQADASASCHGSGSLAGRAIWGVTVYMYSTWFLTNARPSQVRAVVNDITGTGANSVEDDRGGRLWPHYVEFSDVVDSPWERSVTSGSRWSGLADVPAHEYVDERLLGVLAPTQALVADMERGALHYMSRAGVDAEPASFTLRGFLSGLQGEGVLLRSVRLRNEYGSVLIQSEDEEMLRSQLTDLTGDVTGLTVDAKDQRMTLLGDGRILFTDLGSAFDVLTAIRAIDAALEIPAHVR
jgi:hypothetical protein